MVQLCNRLMLDEVKMSADIECPLCTQIGFRSVDALCVALVSAASRNLTCPVCQMSLTGLDKLTIHLFSHTLSQQELQNSNNYIGRNNINTVSSQRSVSQSTVLNHNVFTTQEINPKFTLSGNDGNGIQNIGDIQGGRAPLKTPETSTTSNQNLASLLYLLPISYCPEKLNNSSPNTAGSVKSDESRITMPENIHLVNDNNENMSRIPEKFENGVLNKDSSYIIVSIPPLQDLKKQSETKLPTNSDKAASNELTLSEISNLSGKLLMLDCGNGIQYNNGISVDKSPKPFRVEVSVSSEQQPVPNDTPLDVLEPAQESCTLNREVSTSLNCTSVKNNDGAGTETLSESEGDSAKPCGESIRCQFCHVQVTDPHILTLHHQFVHETSNPVQPETSLVVEQCSQRQKEDSVNEDGFRCHMCSKMFHKQGRLMVHVRVAHTAPSFVGLASRIKENTSVASPLTTAPIPTTTAGTSPKDQSQAKTNGNKRWECTDCGKFFTTKYFLKKHKRIHTGEMPYSCPTCGKSFTFQQSYHKHLLYHSDEKPHTCTDCGRSFKELSTLHNHRRIHTGEKPWACETCGKCFRQRVSYLVHRRIHTGVMPYRCTACNKSFRYKVTQRTHKCTAQPPGSVVRQPGDLLQRLLFGHSGEGGPSREPETPSQENRTEMGRPADLAHGQIDRRTFLEQRLPENAGTEILVPGKLQSHDQGTQLLYSSVDKVFSGTSVTDFTSHNLPLQQQILQNTSNISQNNAVLQNPANEEPKRNALGEKASVNVSNSDWCVEGTSARRDVAGLNSSSLVVVVNEKESVIPISLSDPRASMALLQVLQKEKCVPNTQFPSHVPVSTSGSMQSNPANSADVTKHNDMILPTSYVPDFLSMVISTSSQSQTSGPNCGDSSAAVGDPFQWEMSLDIPNNSQNDSINDNASASQEAIESLQNLLFGTPSANL